MREVESSPELLANAQAMWGALKDQHQSRASQAFGTVLALITSKLLDPKQEHTLDELIAAATALSELAGASKGKGTGTLGVPGYMITPRPDEPEPKPSSGSRAPAEPPDDEHEHEREQDPEDE